LSGLTGKPLDKMTPFEKYSLVVAVTGIAVTLLAVIVAIWGETIRQFWAAPKLVLGLGESAFNTTSAGQAGWYYILEVSNSRRSYPAVNVRVLLTRVQKKGPDGSWQEKEFSGPSQVMWRWPLQMPLYLTVGPPNAATFGALLEDNGFFQLQLYHYPNNLGSARLVKAHDPTRLEFQAVSDSSTSRKITVEVSWDGEFHTGKSEMAKHCVVKQIEPSR
jgi:hypothetical protein